MRINIVEKNEIKLYGIENQASVSSDFTSFWKNYYKYVAADYNAPVGFITAPDEHGDFRYYTCIGYVPKNSDRFKEVILTSGNYWWKRLRLKASKVGMQSCKSSLMLLTGN